MTSGEMADARSARVREITEAHQGLRGPLLPVLHAVNDQLGHIEPGEEPEQAAVREVREETGLDVERLYNVRVQPFYLHKLHVVQLAIVFAAFVGDGEVVLGGEHQRSEWLSVSEALERLAFPAERTSLREIIELLATGDAGAIDDVMRVF